MTLYGCLLAAGIILLVDGVFFVGTIGKPREPISGFVAVVGVVEIAFLFATVIHAAYAVAP